MRATLWCQILAVELDEIVRILKLFFSLLYLIFEINIYKWADLIQIVCTGQNLVAMLKYKYLFFFYRISCITNNWKPMFCSMTFWWTVYFTRSEIIVNLQFLFNLHFILKSCVFTDFICETKVWHWIFFLILIRGRFSLELLSLHIVINASAILACVRYID